MSTDLLNNCEGFEWDEGNVTKNWEKHKVTRIECEQVFFNKPFIVGDDPKHSKKEKRWYLLGQTDQDRLIFIVFTIRGKLIHIISEQDMNRNERKQYDEQIKKDTEL